MKLGILTQPLHNNYGGLLQNYALQQVLQKMGVDSETIDHGSKSVGLLKSFGSRLKQSIVCYLKPSTENLSKYQPSEKEIRIISKNSRCFIDKYITHTQPFRSEKELSRIIKSGHYDGYIVGSDQCWRPSYCGGFLKEMFLDFVEDEKNILRVAYAVSFGTDIWEYSPEMTAECGRLAKKFDLITVREKSGVELCKTNWGLDSVQVLDPTLLLLKEDYIKLVNNEGEPQSNGNLFYYILDPNKAKTDFINRISTSEGMSPFTVLPRFQVGNRTYNDIKHHIDDCIYPSVTSWLRGFMDSKMVVVDSFHGAVFSIIFNKPFWVIGNKKRGNARFESLLELFHLENRMVHSDNLSSINWNDIVDWSFVNKILENERVRCLDLLAKTINEWK